MNAEIMQYGNEIGFAESMSRGELEVAMMMAKRNPRSIGNFRTEAMTMATLDIDVAMSCFYKMKRGGKIIEGPSVRLAEIAASAWGNMKFGGRVVETTDSHVTAQGVAFDLERNTSYSIEVRRSIRDREGRRYSDDMIVMAGNAAAAIAVRNAIFKVVPTAYVRPIFERAKLIAIGDVKTLGMRRQGMIDEFAKMGVSKESILARLGKATIEDIGLSEFEDLVGVFTAIRDGETNIDAEFPVVSEPTPQEKEAITKAKKKRAELNKLLSACDNNASIKDAVASFQAENGPGIWGMKTHHNAQEKYQDLVDLHSARISDTIKGLMSWISNSKNEDAFNKHLEEFKKHPELDTQDNQDEIIKVGKSLGIAEYFDGLL